MAVYDAQLNNTAREHKTVYRFGFIFWKEIIQTVIYKH